MGRPVVARSEGIEFLRDSREIMIQELLDSGKYYTRREIYQKLKDEGQIDCSEGGFTQYFKREEFTIPERFHGGSPPKSHKRKTERLRELSDLIESLETNDAQILAERMGLRQERVHQLAQELGIPLVNTPTQSDKIIKRRNPIRDAVIAHDPPHLSLEKLAQAEAGITGRSVTRERMRQYLVGTDQERTWRERSDAYKQQLKDEEERGSHSKQQLVDLLLAYLVEKARQESPAAEKAVMYHLRNRNHNPREEKTLISLERLLGFFTEYYTAKEQGQVLSLEELGRPYNLHFAAVGKILKKVGLEPLNGLFERHPTPTWKKQALRRGKDIALPTTAIAYLLGIPDHVAAQNIRRYGRERDSSVDRYNSFLKQFGSTKERNQEFVRYDHASQLYEALDVGFSREEACEYADISKRASEYLIQHRTAIEPKLVEAIRILYEQPAYNKPYVTTELKEKAVR